MKRRKLLLGIGTVAGTSGVVGSGAFTSVEADRTAAVAVAGDQDAFLELEPCDSPNGEYVQMSGGLLTLDLSDDNPTTGGGTGVNPNATTVFDDVFEVRNSGTQPVGVWLDLNATPKTTPDGPAIEFYLHDDQGTPVEGQSNARCLSVGESICVGFVVRTQGIQPGESLFDPVPSGDELTINADADVACGTPGGSVSPRRLSTGVADWQVTDLPVGVQGTGSTPYAAHVVEDPPSQWATSTTDAVWVDPFDTGGLDSDPADADDPYVYEVTFEGPGTLVIEEFGSDNPVEFFLDGTQIGGSGGQNSYGSLTSGFSESVGPGTHTLGAEVLNRPTTGNNPTGLLVAARLDP
jgi:hypothetical protein